MTIEQYWSRLKAHGFTPYKMREGYAILTGPEGQPVGITVPDHLSPEQRIEDLTSFLKTNTLC